MKNKVTKKHFTDIVASMLGLELTPYFLKVKNADGRTQRTRTERQTFLKRNPDGWFIRSVRNGKLVKIINRERIRY